MGSRWRDGLASQLQRLERGDVTLVALLVASTEQQVTDAAAACALFPQIEGLLFKYAKTLEDGGKRVRLA